MGGMTSSGPHDSASAASGTRPEMSPVTSTVATGRRRSTEISSLASGMPIRLAVKK